MSLVHEALQKSEREKQRKSGNIPLAVSSSRPVATQDFSHVPLATQAREKAAEASRPSLPPSAEPSAGPKFSQALLTMLISCVALVAIVAIVLMMNHATVGNRDAPKTTGPAEANNAAQPP